MKAGLMGASLPHSLSPKLHGILGLSDYSLLEVKKEEIPVLLKKEDFSFFNVTIPYKKEILPYLDECSDEVKRIGACNTVIKVQGKWKGFNTDYFGIQKTFEHFQVDCKGKKVLILGTGGGAVTLKAYFETAGAREIQMVSRHPKKDQLSYLDLALFQDAEILCNATPVGMYPEGEKSPIDLSLFSNLEFVFDLVYNPIRTRLILQAEERKIPCATGLYMLAAQGYCSEKLAGLEPELSPDQAYERLLKEIQNLVIIGMPTSGKTTLGKILGGKTGKEVIDLDEYIESLEEGTIPEIFQMYGEEGFRNLETFAVSKLSQKMGCILSCGGGTPLRKENVLNLKGNGKICYLNRPLEKLFPSKNRPLSSTKEDLKRLYEKRNPIYLEAADQVLEGNLTLEELGEKLCGYWF